MTFLFTFLGGGVLSSDITVSEGLQLLGTEPIEFDGPSPPLLLLLLFFRLAGWAGPGTRGPMSSGGGKREEQPQQAISSRRNFIVFWVKEI